MNFDLATLGVPADPDPDSLRRANYRGLVRQSLETIFPEAKSRRDRRALGKLLSTGGAYDLRDFLAAHPSDLGKTVAINLPLSDEADLFFKGKIDAATPEDNRKLKDKQLAWLNTLESQGRIHRVLHWRFLSRGDSREPELAGIRGAAIGSALTLLITLALCFPIGVATAVYLEELLSLIHI